jgi:hypothetical protein
MKRKWTFILLPGELLSTASGQPCVWSSRCDKIAKRRLGTPEKSRRIVWTIVSLSLVLGVTVQAGEIGHYAGGLVNIRDVIMPPAPGVYAAVYYYYTTDQLNNANGDKISSVNINPGPGPGVTVNVHVDVNIDVIVPILMWVAPPKILGAHYVGFIAPSFADSGLDAALSTATGRGVGTNTKSFGVGDLFVEPIWLDWSYYRETRRPTIYGIRLV